MTAVFQYYSDNISNTKAIGFVKPRSPKPVQIILIKTLPMSPDYDITIRAQIRATVAIFLPSWCLGVWRNYKNALPTKHSITILKITYSSSAYLSYKRNLINVCWIYYKHVFGSSVTILFLHGRQCEMTQYFSFLIQQPLPRVCQGHLASGHCLLTQLAQGQLKPGSPPSSLSKPNNSKPKLPQSGIRSPLPSPPHLALLPHQNQLYQCPKHTFYFPIQFSSESYTSLKHLFMSHFPWNLSNPIRHPMILLPNILYLPQFFSKGSQRYIGFWKEFECRPGNCIF